LREESLILGYRMPILRGVWERVTTFGALRMWSHTWAIFCVYLGLLALSLIGVKWMLIPLALWFVGQGVLILLTQWNERFDEMIGAQLRRRYRSHYDAG
jgi:hypothetical protein